MVSENWWWGRSASVDLHNCDSQLVKNRAAIRRFIRALIKELKMKRVDPAIIKRFGPFKAKDYVLYAEERT